MDGAAAVLFAAARELARALVAAPDVLLAVHLVGLGFLPLAVAGASLHVLPTLLLLRPRPGRPPGPDRRARARAACRVAQG